MQKRYKIDVLDYIITSNHVHLLLTAKNGARISDGLRYLHGRVAQFYNLQTGKDGAFWSDRFHSTLIQDGKHFGSCLFYIDLNMVRAGVVRHPSKWDACAYHEFYREKSKYRIVNMQRLLQVLGIGDIEHFRKWHTLTINEMMIKQKTPEHAAFWSKAFAVGDETWLKEQLKSSGIKRMNIKQSGEISFATGGK
jgi:putative transposase